MKTEVCLVLCQVMMPQEKLKLPTSFPISTKIISFFPLGFQDRILGCHLWLLLPLTSFLVSRPIPHPDGSTSKQCPGTHSLSPSSLCERSSPSPRPLQSLPKWSCLHPCTTSKCPQTLPSCFLYFSSAQDFLTVSYLMPRRTRVCTVVQGHPPPNWHASLVSRHH